MTLENLLNKLIELGRKPWGIIEHLGLFIKDINICIKLIEDHYPIDRIRYKAFSLNDLCSPDSGLWQFVCGLDKDYLPFCSKCNIKLESNNDKIKGDVWYEEEVNFWLMLSSIQENKEKFLLDNIKI